MTIYFVRMPGQNYVETVRREELKPDASNAKHRAQRTQRAMRSPLTSRSMSARTVISGSRGRVWLAGSGVTLRSSSKSIYSPDDDEKSTPKLEPQNQKS